MNIKELNEAFYKVYSPSEEASEPNVSRSTFDSKEIRNIMMSYFMQNPFETVEEALRSYIDMMPDEWVIEFLRNQGDTIVEEVANK